MWGAEGGREPTPEAGVQEQGTSGSFGKKEGVSKGRGSLFGVESNMTLSQRNASLHEVGWESGCRQGGTHGGTAWVMHACVASGGLAGGPRAGAHS